MLLLGELRPVVVILKTPKRQHANRMGCPCREVNPNVNEPTK